MMISPILIFWAVKGWDKSAKNSPKWKVKVNLSCATPQEQYSIWSWFLVLKCKMMITPGIFSIFQNFDFLCCWWGKSAKNGPKWQKILSVVLHISGTIHYMIISPSCFSVLSKFCFPGLLGGKILSVVLHISGTIHHMIISPSCFSVLSKFWFPGVLGGGGGAGG